MMYHVFQSTLPRRERLDGQFQRHPGGTDFNPRSHEGSDIRSKRTWALSSYFTINLYQYFPSYFLSLPSPYNFCTFILVRVLLYYRVYLPFAQQSYNKNMKWQSNTLTGTTMWDLIQRITIWHQWSFDIEHDFRTKCYQKAWPVQIHAPTKGATMLCCVFLAKNLFQSTLPRRERRGVCKKFANGTIFQSTLPRRERLY